MRVHRSQIGRLGDGADPSVGGTPVEAPTVAAEKDRPASPFPNRLVDGPGGAGNQRDRRRLVPLAGDAKRPVSPLEAEVFDIGRAGF